MAVLQLFQYFPTKVVQNNSEWPILAVLQLFQYFPTEVVQIDSEWPILAIFQVAAILFFFPLVVFGSFGLPTKEPYTIMLCPSCIIGVGVGVCAHLS